MKKEEIRTRREMKRLIEYIRNYYCFRNENYLQISVGYCNKYGASVQVYPSEFYPWFSVYELDYFRAWSIVADWSFIIESQNGVPVLDFHYHI